MTDLFSTTDPDSTTEPDEHALFIEFLRDQHTTLWGQAFDVKTKSAPEAATWFLDQRDRFDKWKADR